MRFAKKVGKNARQFLAKPLQCILKKEKKHGNF